MRRELKMLAARYRLALGFCPACNSDAPAIDRCGICGGYRDTFPPTKEIKDQWWSRYMRLVIDGEKK